MHTLQATQAPEPFILVLHADMLFRKALTPELLDAQPGEPSDINGAIARMQSHVCESCYSPGHGVHVRVMGLHALSKCSKGLLSHACIHACNLATGIHC